MDEFGFREVNFSHLAHGGSHIFDDPYIFASQATKVFYIKDEWHRDCSVVKQVKVRDAFDLGHVFGTRRRDDGEGQDSEMETRWVRTDVDDEEDEEANDNEEIGNEGYENEDSDYSIDLN